ncbi:MAG TPA: alpha/beta hydrolase [Candidatus Binataceae bacterium]|nr:alpha/beta hydrolase [Candidatus Binataceae bacterium]
MDPQEFSLNSAADGIAVAHYRWLAPQPAIGVVQIAHGMGEHALRYAALAEFLNNAGFHVYASDHRGHGRSAPKPELLGDFGAAGWDALVADMAQLTRHARANHGALPIVLLGHSMGSFAAQQYLLDHSELIAGVILSGSASLDLLFASSAQPEDSSKPADLTALNRDFEPARTQFDWLSRDAAEVDKYIADPLCGFGVDARARASMAAGGARTVEATEVARIRKDLPIFIFAGDKDPVNHHLEWLRPLADRYRAAGIKDVSEKYYRDGRHEMLNETNRAEVMNDILVWLRGALGD